MDLEPSEHFALMDKSLVDAANLLEMAWSHGRKDHHLPASVDGWITGTHGLLQFSLESRFIQQNQARRVHTHLVRPFREPFDLRPATEKEVPAGLVSHWPIQRAEVLKPKALPEVDEPDPLHELKSVLLLLADDQHKPMLKELDRVQSQGTKKPGRLDLPGLRQIEHVLFLEEVDQRSGIRSHRERFHRMVKIMLVLGENLLLQPQKAVLLIGLP